MPGRPRGSIAAHFAASVSKGESESEKEGASPSPRGRPLPDSHRRPGLLRSSFSKVLFRAACTTHKYIGALLTQKNKGSAGPSFEEAKIMSAALRPEERAEFDADPDKLS